MEGSGSGGGKTLPPATIDGESLGLMVFRQGRHLGFQAALNKAIQ
jgi:hypothetical protein